MKKTFTILSLLIISSLAFAQVPLLVEDFNYTAGDDLTAHGWASHSGTANPILVTTPGLTFAGYTGSDVGLSAGVNNTGYDLNKLYTEQTSGSVYTSFMVNATTNTGKGGYFFHYFDPNANTAFRARTFIKPLTGKMMIGFSFNASACQDSSLTALLNFGETYLFVVKYTIKEGATNDNVSLYVFKAGDNFTTEPATPFLGPLTATRTTPSDPLSALGPDIRPMGIALRQFEAAQKITVDGFRVKTKWELTQDEVASLAVSANTVPVAGTAGSTNTFDIISNASWTAVSDQDWLTVSSGSGSGNATVTVTATENPASAPRTANVTVAVEGLPAQEIVVTQEISTAGIEESANKNFMAYPNPVIDGYLKIVDPKNSAKQIEIYNAVGKRVLFQNTPLNKIDVKTLTSGVYILKVVSGNKTTTSRLIIK